MQLRLDADGRDDKRRGVVPAKQPCAPVKFGEGDVSQHRGYDVPLLEGVKVGMGGGFGRGTASNVGVGFGGEFLLSELFEDFKVGGLRLDTAEAADVDLAEVAGSWVRHGVEEIDEQRWR